MATTNARLTEGSVVRHLITTALPTMIGIVAIMLFVLVDTFWVSRLGTAQLAAISFTFPISFIVMGISIGLSAGATSVIARAIGQGNSQKVQDLTLHSLLLALFVVLITSTIGLLTMEPLFTLLGADAPMRELIKSFMIIWYAGLAFLVVPMSAGAALRATGDSLIPGIAMLLSGVVNAILDPIFIFGLFGFPRMEMAGAALATVVSWSLVCVAMVHRLVVKEKMLALRLPHFRPMLRSWKQLLQIGVPAATTQTLSPLANGVMTSVVASYGAAEVAGFGLGCRIEPIAIVPMISLSIALNPFIAQNWGAGFQERVEEALHASMRFSMIFGLALCPLLALGAYPLGHLFSSDPRAVDTLVWFLWLLPISYGAEGVVILASSGFNAFHRPMRAAMLNVVRLLALYVPLGYAASCYFGVYGVFIGASVANLVSGVIAWHWIKRTAAEVGYVELTAPDDPRF